MTSRRAALCGNTALIFKLNVSQRCPFRHILRKTLIPHYRTILQRTRWRLRQWLINDHCVQRCMTSESNVRQSVSQCFDELSQWRAPLTAIQSPYPTIPSPLPTGACASHWSRHTGQATWYSNIVNVHTIPRCVAHNVSSASRCPQRKARDSD